MEDVTRLRIFGRMSPITVLGPGNRAVTWMQGCNRRCVECSAPESWDIAGGYEITACDLSDWVLEQPDIDGITISGGEPMLQAEPLYHLVDRIRCSADLGVVCYTGYRLEDLLQSGTASQRAFLERVDMLIDGPYERDNHASLLWRGSANQRIILLSDRYRSAMGSSSNVDESAGLQFFIGEEGLVRYAGVPAQPGFHQEFKRRLSKQGISLIREPGVNE